MGGNVHTTFNIIDGATTHSNGVMNIIESSSPIKQEGSSPNMTYLGIGAQGDLSFSNNTFNPPH